MEILEEIELKTQIKKMNNYLDSWLKERGFDCQCLFDTDFSFDYNNDVIYYAFTVPDAHDRLFLKLCQQIAPEIEQCDNFILSFFHELGHYVCQDSYTDEDWEEYNDILEYVNEKEDYIVDEDIKEYYNCSIEISATRWSCSYIKEHEQEIAEWWETIKQFISDFMIIFDTEEDE